MPGAEEEKKGSGRPKQFQGAGEPWAKKHAKQENAAKMRQKAQENKKASEGQRPKKTE